jgi:hypothetical protein
MSLPSAWTEASLIGEMEGELEAVAGPLGLDANDLITRAVEKDVPEVLGVASVAGVTYAAVADVIKVLTIARWRAWERAYQATLLSTDLKSGTASLTESQSWEHLRDYLGSLRAAAMRYPEAAVMLAGGVRRPVVGQLATTAPATPLYPPDPNSPAYAGRPAGWWPS